MRVAPLRTEWIMLVLALSACRVEDEAPPPETEDAAPTGLSVALTPETIAFGDVGLGAAVTETLVLANLGGATVTLTAVSSDDESLVVDAPTGQPIAPGASVEVAVTWTPTTPASLSGTLDVLVTGAGLLEIPVPVTGTAGGPVLALSATELDVGSVSAGCTGSASLTLSNAGTTDLHVSALSLPDGSALTMTYGSTLPWTLAPGASAGVDLTYAPRDVATVADLLTISSDDAVEPEAEVTVTGSGLVDERRSDEFVVERPQNVTVVFALNEVAANNGMFAQRWENALPLFFETLQASRAAYRVTFIPSMSGVVNGDTLYIDETVDPADTVDIWAEMVSNASGDNDYLLQTLQDAVDENRDWLLDESDAWAESRLSLVGVNSDMEQSSGNWVTYVATYRDYKDDDADVLVHGIGGSMGSTCAEPFDQFENAATETGGVFLDICAADWDPVMETLAASVLGDVQAFTLSAEPQEWSLDVSIDGATTTDGWTYDADALSIVFDDDHYPSMGAEVAVDYLVAVECPA